MELYPTTGPNDEPSGRAHVVNEDPYAPIPERLLYDVEISAEAVRVYGVLRRHGDDPSNCYPSQARIAKLIGRAPRSINGWLRQLEAAGWIERVPRFTEAGDLDSNGYRVFLVPRAGERGVRATGRGPVRATQRGGYALDGAINESQPNESQVERVAKVEVRATERAEAAERFDTHFWPAYPDRNGKKLDKGKALAQWVKLSIDDQRAAVRGARNYAESGQLPKDAHRWLRDRCWVDWQTPAAAAAQRGTSGDYVAEAMQAMREGR